MKHNVTISANVEMSFGIEAPEGISHDELQERAESFFNAVVSPDDLDVWIAVDFEVFSSGLLEERS